MTQLISAPVGFHLSRVRRGVFWLQLKPSLSEAPGQVTACLSLATAGVITLVCDILSTVDSDLAKSLSVDPIGVTCPAR